MVSAIVNSIFFEFFCQNYEKCRGNSRHDDVDIHGHFLDLFWTKHCFYMAMPPLLEKTQREMQTRGNGGKYQGPSEEIGKGSNLLVADLWGKAQSGIPKVSS